MESDNVGAREACGPGEDSQALNPTILEYYKKFGRKRDLEQYFSLSTAQGEIRDPTSLFWRRMKSLESSDSGEKSRESSMEVCRISIKCSVPEVNESSLGRDSAPISQDNLDETKSDSVSPPIIIEVPQDTSRHSDDDDVKSDDNSQKSMDAVLDTSANKALSPTSSITSQRKLEWDSLADVGYANESDKKTSASSLSTLERLALMQQYSNNDTTQGNLMGLPTAHSTPVDDNEIKTKNKKVSKTTRIYRKDVDTVEVNVPHGSDVNPSQSINVNLTKHISFSVEKDGAVSVDNIKKDVSISPEKKTTETEMTPQVKIDKESQTSLMKKDTPVTDAPNPMTLYGQSIPVLINLNTLKRRHRRRKSKTVRKRSKSRTKSNADKENLPVQEKSGEQVSEAESFEYMPGHIYNQKQIDKESSSNVVDNKSSLESSGAATTDSSKGLKPTFTKDLERGIKLLKETLRKPYDDAELKQKLIKEVVQRLIKTNYSDEESTTDFLSGLSFSSRKVGLRDSHTTTSTSDNTAEKSKPARPKKSILRNDKFNSNAIASTSQSVPNLPSVSTSGKPVSSKLSKPETLHTESDASSKAKTSSETEFAKTSSEELYQKYLEALRREEAYKQHLKEKESFLKHKLVASETGNAGLGQPRLDVKSRIRLKELMNDLTRNNYDDGSGDASKLEGGLHSNLDVRPGLRNYRSQSVFTLSSGNSDRNKKSSFVRSGTAAGNSREGNRFCLCSHSDDQRLGISDSSVQVNINPAEPDAEQACGKSSRAVTKIIPDDDGEIKYLCLCDRRVIEKEVPDNFLIYKCSRLPNKGVQYGASCSTVEVPVKASKPRSVTDNFAMARVSKCSQTNLRDPDTSAAKGTVCVHEAIRCVQTDITIDPKISDASITDMKMIEENDCVTLIREQFRQVSKSTVTESERNIHYSDDGATTSSGRSRKRPLDYRQCSIKTVDAEIQSDVELTEGNIRLGTKLRLDHGIMTDAFPTVEDAATSIGESCSKGVQSQTDGLFTNLKVGSVNTIFSKDYTSLKHQSSASLRSRFQRANTFPSEMGCSCVQVQSDGLQCAVHPRPGILKPSYDVRFQTKDDDNPFASQANVNPKYPICGAELLSNQKSFIRNMNICGSNIPEKLCGCLSVGCHGECGLMQEYTVSKLQTVGSNFVASSFHTASESKPSYTQTIKKSCGCLSADPNCHHSDPRLHSQVVCSQTLTKPSCKCSSTGCQDECQTNCEYHFSVPVTKGNNFNERPQFVVHMDSKPSCSQTLTKTSSCSCAKAFCQGDCVKTLEYGASKSVRSQSLPQESYFVPKMCLKLADYGTRQYDENISTGQQQFYHSELPASRGDIYGKIDNRRQLESDRPQLCACGCGKSYCFDNCKKDTCDKTRAYQFTEDRTDRRNHGAGTAFSKPSCDCGCGRSDCDGNCKKDECGKPMTHRFVEDRLNKQHVSESRRPICECGCGKSDCHGDCDRTISCKFEEARSKRHSKRLYGSGKSDSEGDCENSPRDRARTLRFEEELAPKQCNMTVPKTGDRARPLCDCGCGRSDCHGGCETNPCDRAKTSRFDEERSNRQISTTIPKTGDRAKPLCDCGCGRSDCHGECETNPCDRAKTSRFDEERSNRQISTTIPKTGDRAKPLCDCGCGRSDCHGECETNPCDRAKTSRFDEERSNRQISTTIPKTGERLRPLCDCGCGRSDCRGECETNPCDRAKTSRFDEERANRQISTNIPKTGDRARPLCDCGCGRSDCYGECEKNSCDRAKTSRFDEERANRQISTNIPKTGDRARPLCDCGCGRSDCHGECEKNSCDRAKTSRFDEERANRQISTNIPKTGDRARPLCDCGCGRSDCHGECETNPCDRAQTSRFDEERSNRQISTNIPKTGDRARPLCDCGCGRSDCYGECEKNSCDRVKTSKIEEERDNRRRSSTLPKTGHRARPLCDCGCGRSDCHGECENDPCDKANTSRSEDERTSRQYSPSLPKTGHRARPLCDCGCGRSDCHGDCKKDPCNRANTSKFRERRNDRKDDTAPLNTDKYGKPQCDCGCGESDCHGECKKNPCNKADRGIQHSDNVETKTSASQTTTKKAPCGCPNTSCQGDCERNPDCGDLSDKDRCQETRARAPFSRPMPKQFYEQLAKDRLESRTANSSRPNETKTYRMSIAEGHYGSAGKSGECEENPESLQDSDAEDYETSDDPRTDLFKLAQAEIRPSRELIMNVIQDITNRYAKKDVEKNERKKCFKEILSLLNYLLDTDDTDSETIRGIRQAVAENNSSESAQNARKSRKCSFNSKRTKRGTDSSSPDVSYQCKSADVKEMKSVASCCPDPDPQNRGKCDKGIQLCTKSKTVCCTESSELPVSSELPCTSSDSATCKVLNKIRKECEKYHQKRCKGSKQCDCTSTTSVSCNRCNRVHHCMCRSHKCKGCRPRNVCERIKKKCVAYNLIIQTSESMIGEETTTVEKGFRPLKNIIVKVPSKRNPCDEPVFKEEPFSFSPRSEGRARSRSVPNETYFSSTDEGKAKMITIRNYLEKNRPDFIDQCNKRQRCLKMIGETRANERAARELLSLQMQVDGPAPLLRGLSDSDLREIARELGIHLRQRRAAPKFISEREMKKHSEKIYKSLPEVVKKKEELRKENIKKTNLLMANIFKKNLQKKALRGTVSLSNYSPVIKI